MNGYIYLNTLIPGGYNFLNFHTIILTVQIQDKAGHYSKPMEFSLYFDPRANVQEEPPNGVFKEQALGPIMVNLHPFDVGGEAIEINVDCPKLLMLLSGVKGLGEISKKGNKDRFPNSRSKKISAARTKKTEP